MLGYGFDHQRDPMRVNEVFYSLQGEGFRAGRATVFVRFSGCNLKCAMQPGEHSIGGFDCDTEFVSGVDMTAADLIARCVEVLPDASPEFRKRLRPMVIFTGGEPGLQLTPELVRAFHDSDFRCGVETNGSLNLFGLGLDWVTVSPKVAEHAVRHLRADEIKYVRGHGQGIPRPTCKADLQYISPAFDGLRVDPAALAWCIKLVKENPDWILSVQQHKFWGIR